MRQRDGAGGSQNDRAEQVGAQAISQGLPTSGQNDGDGEGEQAMTFLDVVWPWITLTGLAIAAAADVFTRLRKRG